tara:strand:- start:1202 stop:1618 length:417 start_codon:yes stop_codon:yes gene_type:complete
MEFDPKRKAIEVQKKIFFDDLELAIKKKNQLTNFDILNSNKEIVNQNIKNYLQENIDFIINGKPLDINYLGHEYINGTINCYFEILKVKKIKKLIIKDSSLFASFKDQENLIYFETLNDLQTIRLKNPNDTHEIIVPN